jgi:hypothetical protein
MSRTALQNILLDGLRLGAGGAIAVEFKTADGSPLKTATVKAKGDQTETLPLYTNKDKVAGEVPSPPPPFHPPVYTHTDLHVG